MKRLFLITAVLLFLQGCRIVPTNGNQKPEVVSSSAPLIIPNANANDDYLYYYISHSYSSKVRGATAESIDQLTGVQTESNGYGHLYRFNGEKSLILGEIVSKMADQLLYNFPRQYYREAIALTSIVDLNDLKSTSWLGQTISEQFIHELHIRKLQVIDFKLTGNIQLTDRGEFALTRDWKKLNKDVEVERILTGTMSRNEEGIMLNVRIVNVNTNIVESTSSAFIPHNIFMGGDYNYQKKKYLNRTSGSISGNKSQVRLVK